MKVTMFGPFEQQLCRCGCGDFTPSATRTSAKYGYFAGKPLTYIPGHGRRGQKMTLEQRERCRNAQMGHSVSEATRKKISETRKKLGYRPNEEAIRNSHAKRYFGEQNPHWRGGKSITNGYEIIRMPDHPRAHPNGFVYTHVLVAEAKIGRPLNTGEIVHHIDGNQRNNTPENLMVLGSQSEHMRLHAQERAHKK